MVLENPALLIKVTCPIAIVAGNSVCGKIAILRPGAYLEFGTNRQYGAAID